MNKSDASESGEIGENNNIEKMMKNFAKSLMSEFEAKIESFGKELGVRINTVEKKIKETHTTNDDQINPKKENKPEPQFDSNDNIEQFIQLLQKSRGDRNIPSKE